MLNILFLSVLSICLLTAVGSISYAIVKSYTYKPTTLTLVQPDRIIVIPINNIHSITAVSQGQVLVTTILQEQFVGVLVKV